MNLFIEREHTRAVWELQEGGRVGRGCRRKHHIYWVQKMSELVGMMAADRTNYIQGNLTCTNNSLEMTIDFTTQLTPRFGCKIFKDTQTKGQKELAPFLSIVCALKLA